MRKVTLADIHDARNILKPLLPSSPLIHNAWLSEAFGCEVHLKMENMQPIGSFKIRGATVRVARLTEAEKRAGVIAASAGNHAQGVAWGGRQLGVDAMIVMPRGAPITKIENTRALGAQVVLAGENYDEAYATAQEAQLKTGRVFVPAFEDPDVISGQGTCGLEIIEQLPDADYIIGSIGGGGLMAGIGLVYHELSPRTRLLGCQAAGAPSMLRSFREGKAISLETAHTFADGIAVMKTRESMREILASTIHGVMEADDDQIAQGVLTLLEKAKVVSEGAGAVPLAVLEQLRPEIQGKKVVLVISGGNIDVNVLSRIIDRGLTRSGRRLRVNVLLSDRPGSLAKLTDLIARKGGNVLQAIHDRNEPSTTIDLTEVALTLETRGREHSEELIAALRDHVIRLELGH
jgi:threonine dehydratase